MTVVDILWRVLALLRRHAGGISFARNAARAKDLPLHLVLGFEAVAIFGQRTLFHGNLRREERQASAPVPEGVMPKKLLVERRALMQESGSS